MGGRRNPKRWVIKRLANGPASGHDLVLNSKRNERILPAIWALKASGHITQDPPDYLYRLTEHGQDTLMRITRKKKPEQVTNLAAERERLILDFNGPHALAITTVEDDPVLSERLAIAIEQEMPAVDLISVPLHRRAATVEEALEQWFHSTRLGPCGFCGTRTTRRSAAPLSHLDPAEVPGFQDMHGQKACGWCAYMLSSRTLDDFKSLIFNAVAGTWGTPIVGEYRHTDDLVPFAHEVGHVGQPWAHLQTEERVWAIRARAYKVVHKTRFVVRPEQARLVSIPGVETTVWPREALPGQERKWMKPSLSQQVAYAEETAELEKRREKATYDRLHKYDQINRGKADRAAREAENEKALRDRARKLGVL